jgi:hypothetical protein
MKYILILLLSFSVLEGCRKSETTTTFHPAPVVEYDEIFLDSSLRVVKVIATSEDSSIRWIATYHYSDALIKTSKIFSDSSFTISTFHLGQNGFAESSVDTVYSYQVFRIDSSRYTYDSACYLKTWERGDMSASFTEENGDLIHFGNYHYSYYNTLNKIDIHWSPIYNGIAGKICKHLIREINGYFGLGSYSTSTYQYSMYPDGYVKVMNETRISGNYDQNFVFTEYYSTRYKYIFNYSLISLYDGFPLDHVSRVPDGFRQ